MRVSIDIVPYEAKYEESALTVAREIHAQSLYKNLPLDWGKVLAQFTAPDRYFRLAVRREDVLGGFYGCVLRVFFCDALIANEIGWWVASSARGSAAAVMLLFDFESWARQKGAVLCTVDQSGPADHERTAKLFQHCGYRVSGFNAVKEL